MLDAPAPPGPDGRRRRQAPLVCANCGREYIGWYVRRYCSDRCRMQAHDERRGLEDPGHAARRTAAWRRANPEADRRDRERTRARDRERRAGMTAEERAALNAGMLARTRGYQRASLEAADNHRTPWISADDAYLVAHWDDRYLDQAIALGRTVYAIKDRRKQIRERLLHRGGRTTARPPRAPP